MRDLATRGLVERIAGSGTYVRRVASSNAMTFGLLIPELGTTEIFEPICRGIAASPQAREHALLWGHEQSPSELCGQFVERRVAGVFFAPIESGPEALQTNIAIVERFEAARIPVILLDRCVLPYPRRSRHDLVGIDNRRAGFLATEHLLRLDARHISLIAHRTFASTVEARITGFREALLSHGREQEIHAIHRLDVITHETVSSLLKENDAFVCANDRTAGQLMRVLTDLGANIPRDFRMVGIDDVEYASLLPVPLTTVHQPCRQIGEAAMGAMLERVARPDMFVRDILVECHLVVRESCGAHSIGRQQPA